MAGRDAFALPRLRPMAAARAAACVAALLPALLPLAGAMGPTHAIFDYEADVRDLDVGDLDDMESDVTPYFLDDMKKRKTPQPTFEQMREDPSAWMGSSGMSGSTKMGFTTLTLAKSEELGMTGTEALARQWTGLMTTGGVNAQLYATDPGKILVVTHTMGLMAGVKKFVLAQPEVDYWEMDQKRQYPEGRTEAIDSDEKRNKRELELGWRKPSKDEQKKEKEKKKKDKKSKGKAKRSSSSSSSSESSSSGAAKDGDKAVASENAAKKRKLEEGSTSSESQSS
mmetsp:Transcript_45071/g.126976  ORF Transcript_45071/g.126976 Transcript_45071/m.126976 type:complete len:283 (-) Transcript_45071:196-1044(-)